MKIIILSVKLKHSTKNKTLTNLYKQVVQVCTSLGLYYYQWVEQIWLIHFFEKEDLWQKCSIEQKQFVNSPLRTRFIFKVICNKTKAEINEIIP